MGASLVSTAPATDYYHSVLAGDPDLAEIIAMFVDEMPGRVRDLQSHFGCANWDQLGRLAHQIKGAAGSYGFDQIAPFASNLEKSIRTGQPVAQVQAALDDLIDACSRLRAGTGA